MRDTLMIAKTPLRVAPLFLLPKRKMMPLARRKKKYCTRK
jgi:hypothetical protein